MREVLIVNAEVAGRPGVDVRIGDGVIVEIGAGLRRCGDVVDAHGGALIPGLHDHHVHLRSLIAAQDSVSLAGSSFDSLAEWADGAGWLRVIGASGPEFEQGTAAQLDRVVPDRPVRVQHRSGAVWLLNTRALELLAVDGWPDSGVERDGRGRPTGRLFRLDHRLSEATAALVDDERWRRLSEDALRYGITGFTDATVTRPLGDEAALQELVERGVIAQQLLIMGERPGSPRKIVLDDTMLPDVGELAVRIDRAHGNEQSVAIHCVTADQLVVALAAWRQCAARAGDRIEHASVIPPGFADQIAQFGLGVVTQPGFVHAHGDRYLRDVAPDEQPWLYPVASLLAAGVTVAFSSDAPYGPLDPWLAIAAASRRRTADGRPLGPAERVDPATALGAYLRAPDDLGRQREIVVGQTAQLCLLHRPLAEVLADPGAEHVRAGISGTQMIWT